MQGRHWVVIVALVLVAVAGCKTLERGYCEANFGTPGFADTEECCKAYPEACESGGVCASSEDCVAFGTPYCLVDKQECVQCLDSSHCTELNPVCDEQTNKCVQCRSHGDCESDLCLDSGTCAAAADVIYVSDSSTGGNAECSQERSCQDLVQALAVTPLRKYIRVTGAISTGLLTSFDAVEVDVYGTPGTSGASVTTLTRSTSGVVLEAKRGAKVNLFDLEVNGSTMGDAVNLKDNVMTTVVMKRVRVRAPNGNGILIEDGKLTLVDSEVRGSSLVGVSMVKGALAMDRARVVDNMQDGVKATGGTVDIQKSLIAGNKGTAGIFTTTGASMVTIESTVITLNTGTNGGASIANSFSIRNSIIARNGSGNTTVGGLSLNTGNGTVEFNTVANNLSSSNLGISCVVPTSISNSILTGNSVSGGCGEVTFSLADTMLSGAGNKTGNPMFLSTDAASPSSPMFYRIGAASAARDAAGASQLANDIDGDPRPGTGKDMGADEYAGP